ncbi:MAG: DUF2946 domain-containing protein [Shimia sp.]|uniref:DUF2946 domain-containing protein n=1 Tax=Shimia sp. TaxID=1954381 RepID=UPI00405A461C
MRLLTGLLLLLALAHSAAMPKGWMPVALADGHFAMVICTGEDMMQIVVDESGTPVPYHERTGDSHNPCAFGQSADLQTPATLMTTLLLGAAISARWQTATFTHESAGFHRRYDARGPPILS